jgi:hypothetical protein
MLSPIDFGEVVKRLLICISFVSRSVSSSFRIRSKSVAFLPSASVLYEIPERSFLLCLLYQISLIFPLEFHKVSSIKYPLISYSYVIITDLINVIKRPS